MVRLIIAAAGLGVLCGCGGILTVPMVQRLSPEAQQNVDDAWVNLLTPVNRLDRALLLDTLMMHQLHEAGVDELRLVSKKHVGDGLVVMEVDYAREQPELDAFTVTYINGPGMELRRERYTFDEIRERIRYLVTIDPRDPNSPGLSDADRAAILAANAQREARFGEVQAATQPARE